MKSSSIFHLFIVIWSCNTIRQVISSHKTREADVLNLNAIQDGEGGTVRGRERGTAGGKRKDSTITESQENRSFFKPDADRRGGSFYPSGPPPGQGIGSNFPTGTSFPSSGTNFHTSGNGFSYGTPLGPSSDFPSVSFGGSFPSRPSSPSGGQGSYGAGLGGTYPLIPAGGAGGGGHSQAMMIKGLLLPLAGVALLGAAAVLAKSNPVLLQLGVVHGKRRRRNVDKYPENPFVKPEKTQ